MRQDGNLDEDTLVRSDNSEEWVRFDALFNTEKPHAESLSETNTSVPSADPKNIHRELADTLKRGKSDLQEYVNSINAKKQAAEVLSDLRAINFRDEIAPLDAQTFGLLKKDFVFWTVILLGVFPTLLVTLNSPSTQLTGFLLFFAAIWGVIFKNFILAETSSWKLPLGTLFFTGTVGIPVYLFIFNIIPNFYASLPTSENFLLRFLGSILTTGISEELLKIIPVVGYIAWKKSEAVPLTIITLGVFSGLGFAAFENIHYAGRAIYKAIGLTSEFGYQGLEAGVTEAMVNVMLRSMSLVFAHATFSGIFAYFIAIGVVTEKRRLALGLVGLTLSATAHGLYNFLWSVQDLLPSVITALSFILFYSYLTKFRVLTESSPVLERE
jgi:RsiW-degrading membrane proteinase PrsW (M82 family)